jgi:hypothetical protein
MRKSKKCLCSLSSSKDFCSFIALSLNTLVQCEQVIDIFIQWLDPLHSFLSEDLACTSVQKPDMKSHTHASCMVVPTLLPIAGTWHVPGALHWWPVISCCWNGWYWPSSAAAVGSETGCSLPSAHASQGAPPWSCAAGWPVAVQRRPGSRPEGASSQPS